MKVAVLGTGRAVPETSLRVVDGDFDDYLAARIAAVGVDQRFVCNNESQVDLAAAAARVALEDAGIGPADIDLVISGASVPYQPIPAMAPLIMRELGVKDGAAAAFDVNSTCLSFLTALDVAGCMICGGGATRALVVSAEVASRALPWETQPEVAALFGDGAAAAVIGTTAVEHRQCIKAIKLRSYPAGYEICGIGAGGTRFDFQQDRSAFEAHSTFAMDGKALFRLTTQHFKPFVDEFLKTVGWSADAVDLVVPHQASPAALDHMIRQTGFDPDRVVRIVQDYGNQIAASIPFALDIARKSGRVSEGSKVLLLGTSAGVSFGAAALVM